MARVEKWSVEAHSETVKVWRKQEKLRMTSSVFTFDSGLMVPLRREQVDFVLVVLPGGHTQKVVETTRV